MYNNDDFLKMLTKSNSQNLGDYSPRSGFSNEDTFTKNPYQSIYSSQPNDDKYFIPTDFKIEDYLTQSSAPSNLEMNQDFWNRKDIFDTKQRLDASGINIPEQTNKQDKPNFLIRALNKLSMLGYGVTTGLNNVVDDDKNTTFGQGFKTGINAGWNNTGEEKTASDILKTLENSNVQGKNDFADLLNPIGALGETIQKSDNELIKALGKGTEWTGDFISGFLGDVVLDPTSYVTFGTGSLLKGAGKEVSEATVKNAIGDIAKTGVKLSDDLMKSGETVSKLYDPIKEVERITKKINNINAPKTKGFGFEIPFTNISKEIVSGDTMRNLGDKLGTSKVTKGMSDLWNLNKTDDGLRSILEKIPENIGKKFDTQYDAKKLAKNNPVAFAQQEASNEIVRNIMFNGKEEFAKNSETAKELYERMKTLGIDNEKLLDLLEGMKRFTPTEDMEGLTKYFETNNQNRQKANLNDLTYEYNRGLDDVDNYYDNLVKEGLANREETLAKLKDKQLKDELNMLDAEYEPLPEQDIIGNILSTPQDNIMYQSEVNPVQEIVNDKPEDMVRKILQGDIDNANKTEQILGKQKDISVKPSDIVDNNSDLKGMVTNKDYLGKNALDIARMKPEEMDWFLDEIANSGIDEKAYDDLIDMIDKIQEGMIDDTYIDPLQGAYQTAPKTSSGINNDNIEEAIKDILTSKDRKDIKALKGKYDLSDDSAKQLETLADELGLFNPKELTKYQKQSRKEMLDKIEGYTFNKKDLTNDSFIKDELRNASELFVGEYTKDGKFMKMSDRANEVEAIMQGGLGAEDLNKQLNNEIKKVLGDKDVTKLSPKQLDNLRKEIRENIDKNVYTKRGINGVANSELDELLNKSDFSGDSYDIDTRISNTNDKDTIGRKLLSLLEEEKMLKANDIPVPKRLYDEIGELSEIVDDKDFYRKMFKDLKGTSYDNVQELDIDSLIKQTDNAPVEPVEKLLNEANANTTNNIQNVLEDATEPNNAIVDKKGFTPDYNKAYTVDELNTAKVGDLNNMLKELGIDGRSKLTKKADKIDAIHKILNPEEYYNNAKNVTKEELGKLQGNQAELTKRFKELNVNDETITKFNDLYDKHNRLTSEANAIEHLKNTNDTKQFREVMEGIHGENFKQEWDKTWKLHMDKNYSELAPLTKEEFWEFPTNKETLNKLGIEDSEEVRSFVNDYFDYMDSLAKTEQDWGLLKEGQTVKNMGYVPHKLNRETIAKLTDEEKVAIQRAMDKIGNFGDREFNYTNNRNSKLSITEFNRLMEEETGVKNYFETDLSKLIIQRTWEHSDSFMYKKTQDLYLNTLGTKLDWYTSKSGGVNNIINGTIDIKEMQKQIAYGVKEGNFKQALESVMSWEPNNGLIKPEYVEKSKSEWLDTYNEYKSYKDKVSDMSTYLDDEKLEAMNKKLKNLEYKLQTDLPQRGVYRHLKTDIDSGRMVLVYPNGETTDALTTSMKEGVKNAKIQEGLINETQELSTMTWDDFENLKLKDNRVDVYAIPKEMYDSYSKHMKLQTKQDTGAFISLYDKMMGAWKQMALATPGFTNRNAVGNTFQNYMDIGFKAMNPEYMGMATQVLRGTDKLDGELVKRTGYTGKELNELMRKYGAYEDTQVISELSKAGKGRKTLDEALSVLDGTEKRNPLQKATDWYTKPLNKANDAIEKNAKAHNVIVNLENGMSIQEAVEHANKFLFDYSDLTEFEQDVMKRLMPFYTYNKKMFMLQFDQLATNTKQYKNLYKALKNTQHDLSDEEQSLMSQEERLMLPGTKDEEGNRRLYNNNIGWLQTSNPLAMLSPILKTPMELATNKNFSFDSNIEEYEGQLKNARPLEGLLGSLLGQTKKGEDGKTYIDAKVQHALTNAMPSMRFIDKTVSDFSNKDSGEALLNLLGATGTTFNSDKKVSNEIKRYLEELQNIESNAYRTGTNVRENYKEAQKGKNEWQDLLKALGI